MGRVADRWATFSAARRRAVRWGVVWGVASLGVGWTLGLGFLGAARFVSSSGSARDLASATVPAILSALLVFGTGRGVSRSLGRVVGAGLDGVPDRYWSGVESTTRRGAVTLGVLAMAVTVVVLPTLGVFLDRPSLLVLSVAAIPALGVLLVFLIPCVAGTGEVIRHACVLPYFERKVGAIDTFCHGQALARSMLPLDDLADSLGVPPLSSFGWSDDLAGEPLIWHAPAAGLATVSALLRSLRDANPAPDPHLISDLTRLSHALARAAEAEIRFCLLLRHGDSTSGHEWDVREGTCF